MHAIRRLSLALLALAVLGALLIVAGSGSSTSSSGEASAGAVKVVATTTQVGGFVRAVGGGRVDVVQVLRPNSDPHEYEPRPELAKAIAQETGASADDTLGPAGSDGATYLRMEQHNADAMVRGFTAGKPRCPIAGL